MMSTTMFLARHRDIHMRVTADVLQPRQRGLKALLKWDANRYWLKKNTKIEKKIWIK